MNAPAAVFRRVSNFWKKELIPATNSKYEQETDGLFDGE